MPRIIPLPHYTMTNCARNSASFALLADINFSFCRSSTPISFRFEIAVTNVNAPMMHRNAPRNQRPLSGARRRTTSERHARNALLLCKRDYTGDLRCRGIGVKVNCRNSKRNALNSSRHFSCISSLCATTSSGSAPICKHASTHSLIYRFIRVWYLFCIHVSIIKESVTSGASR